MRQVLDFVYRASGTLAAACLVGICLIVVAQIAGRILDAVAIRLTGDQVGFAVPSAAEISGFLLAGASFLALAPTLRAGGHIRVMLVIQRFGSRGRRRFELFCLAFAALLTGFFAWHTILLVADSWTFGEVSYGIVPVPLWLPQSSVAVGLVVLTVAFLDELSAVLRGREASYRTAGDALLARQDRAAGPPADPAV